MKLFYGPGLCSLAPHILLREADADFTLDRVDDKAKTTQGGRDYRTINPNGYVPALELASGDVLTEGPAIMQYIADLRPEAKLAPPAGSMARYRLQSWLNFITSEIHKSYSPLFRPDMPAEAKAAFKEQLAARFNVIERHLADREYLLDNGYSAADVYLYVVTSWSPFVGLDVARWPAIVALRRRVEARPAVQAALRAEGLLK
jgi:glutathione S-transferase